MNRFLVLTVVCFAVVSTASPPAHGQLIAEWKFDAGDLTGDSSGNGNTLLNYGVTAAADDYDGAAGDSNGSAYFNGTDAWMMTLSTLDLSPYDAVRISWWMKHEGTADAVTILMEHSTNYNVQDEASFLFVTGENRVEAESAGHIGLRLAQGTHTELFPHVQNEWVSYVAEFDLTAARPENVVKLYQNGVILDDAEGYLGLHATNTPYTRGFGNDTLYIGSRANSNFFLNGGLDEFKIEDVIGGTVVAEWKFDEGANFLADSSGNGHDLIGTAVSVADDRDGAGGTSSGSASFDGASQCLQTAAPLDLTPYQHLRFSFAMKSASNAAAMLFEQSVDYNVNGFGNIAVGANFIEPGKGSAGVRFDTNYNIDVLPSANDMEWDDYVVEFNLLASDPADVVTMTINGEAVPDETAWSQHALPGGAAKRFLNDSLFLGARGETMNLFFKGFLDELKIEAFEPQSEELAGDLNGDGFVGSADLDIVRANWGQSVQAGCLSCGDPSGDGMVGSADLDIVRANWGLGAAAAVPEPCAVVLALLGVIGILLGRKR